MPTPWNLAFDRGQQYIFKKCVETLSEEDLRISKELSLKKARKLLFKRAALGTSKGKPIYKIKKSMDELGIPF